MSEIIGDAAFEDYGNAPEVFLQNNAIPAWERLNGDLVRLYVCREIGDRHVLDHTPLMSPATLAAIGRRLLEIADAMGAGVPVLHSTTETANKMLS